MLTIEKTRADAPTGFYEAEAAGLAWLAAARGARIAEVLEVSPGRIQLERITEAVPTARNARDFGAKLALTHNAGADVFGARPDGYTGEMFIGKRVLPTGEPASWGEFYTRDRVLPYLPVALAAGNIGVGDARDVEEACARIAAGDFDDGEAPARLHGDLWNGNVLWSETGVVLIDPAAHGGHRESDLAMLALFGCPYLEDIIAGYTEASPLAPGWRQRLPLHQLHPLAVHAAGHGPSYGHALASAARAVLALR